MKRICIIFLLVSNFTFSQTKVLDTCVTVVKNTEWKSLFELSTTKESKLTLIRVKLKEDSFYPKYEPIFPQRCLLGETPTQIAQENTHCDYKILFILSYSKQKLILDLNQNPEHSFIVDKFNEKNVESILPLFDIAVSTAVFGKDGASGAVMLKITNKNFIKEIKSFLKTKLKKPNG